MPIRLTENAKHSEIRPRLLCREESNSGFKLTIVKENQDIDVIIDDMARVKKSKEYKVFSSSFSNPK